MSFANSAMDGVRTELYPMSYNDTNGKRIEGDSVALLLDRCRCAPFEGYDEADKDNKNQEKGRACPTPRESADLRRIHCYFCRQETLLRCDLCNVAICLDHSVTFGWQNGRSVSRICFRCEEADSVEVKNSYAEAPSYFANTSCICATGRWCNGNLATETEKKWAASAWPFAMKQEMTGTHGVVIKSSEGLMSYRTKK